MVARQRRILLVGVIVLSLAGVGIVHADHRVSVTAIGSNTTGSITIDDPYPGATINANFYDAPPGRAGVKINSIHGKTRSRFDYSLQVETLNPPKRNMTPPTGPSLLYLRIDRPPHIGPMRHAGLDFTVQKRTLRERGIHPLDILVYRETESGWEVHDPYPLAITNETVIYELRTGAENANWMIAGSATNSSPS
jgi:hypothetical protein